MTDRLPIRDRIAMATCRPSHWTGMPCPACLNRADAVLAACPEIAALDHAREGWLASDVIDSALIVWGRSALGNVGDKRGRWLPMPESS